MSRYYNEIYFSELEKEERTGVPSKWLQTEEDERGRALGPEDCDDGNPF